MLIFKFRQIIIISREFKNVMMMGQLLPSVSTALYIFELYWFQYRKITFKNTSFL